MLHIIDQQNSLLNKFIAELRDKEIQKDSMRFRRNMERIGDHATNVAEIVLETSGLQARRETGKKFEM